MTANEAAIRKAYRVAEDKDVGGFINCFTASGTFTDESIGVTYRGQDIGRTVEIYATAFPDMHRELYRFYEDGDTVIVELALQGTHKGLLVLKHLPPLLIAKRRLVGGKCAGRCGGAIRLRQLRNRPFVVRPDGAR
jgi:hypothetical protein